MNKYNKNWFTLIELLVWILVFSLWVVSVFSLIITTLNLNEYNKNYIVAASLAREQIELIRYIRDSNYKKIQVYNQINPNSDDHENLLKTNTYYKIENDFSEGASFPVKLKEIKDFKEWNWDYIPKMDDYKLFLNKNNLYTYCDSSDPENNSKDQECLNESEGTIFYRYIKIDEVKYSEDWVEKTIPDAFKVTSKVIWIKKWYKEFEINTIFTDYKRY